MPVHLGVEPPFTMESPTATYTAFYWLFAAQLLLVAGWIALAAWRRRSVVPGGVLLGAVAIGYFAPPLLNRLTLVWFPNNIPFAYITAFGMRDPVFDFIGYVLFYAGGGYACFLMLANGKGARGVYVVTLLGGVADALFELPFLHFGMYTYYGDQPFLIAGLFPLHWIVINATVPALCGVVILMAVKRGGSSRVMFWRSAFAVVVAGSLTIAVALPVGVALNSTLPAIVVRIAAVLSIAGAMGLVLACAQYASKLEKSELASPVDDNDSRRRNPSPTSRS